MDRIKDRRFASIGSRLARTKSPARHIVATLLVILFLVLCREVFSGRTKALADMSLLKQGPVGHDANQGGHETHDRKRGCSRKRYVGNTYGGWTICVPDDPSTLREAIVFTIGVGRDISFDKAMMSTYGTIHHGWDPTPRAVDFVKTVPPPRGFIFHPYGISTKDGQVTATLPVGNTDSYTISSYKHADAQKGKATTIDVLSLRSMMEQTKLNEIYILKIDIEGAEFPVISSWAKENYRPRAQQILIEFHERYFNYDKSLVAKSVRELKSLGFEVFHRTKLEISFIRID